ncbi:hypothetical protein PCH_Pc22g16080 [Penicillium rubens Wisconsin 54-1255]|uniref:Uncharacterized protein n=1 Tax=Penicillium rubens (strain ATCC 28089 / DSM 1075 / NRRL 1951 / Wisconsin 54-1255) TaxID=500485 RepID=B6HQQ3_PENRW|nr:hypothetical protein PCH_Pc22g16080 [Penicillium rubens Wisconsin 54-1255]
MVLWPLVPSFDAPVKRGRQVIAALHSPGPYLLPHFFHMHDSPNYHQDLQEVEESPSHDLGKPPGQGANPVALAALALGHCLLRHRYLAPNAEFDHTGTGMDLVGLAISLSH